MEAPQGAPPKVLATAPATPAWDLETDPFLEITMAAYRCNLPWENGFGSDLNGNRAGRILERSQSSYTWPPWDERPR